MFDDESGLWLEVVDMRLDPVEAMEEPVTALLPDVVLPELEDKVLVTVLLKPLGDDDEAAVVPVPVVS